jgi:hypothetical protein
LISEEVEADGRVKELPQLPQNLAVSRFWLRQVGQINISILQKTSSELADSPWSVNVDEDAQYYTFEPRFC